MAGSIGRAIGIGLSVNTKNFAKSLRSAEKNLERFKNGVKVLGTAVAAGFAAMGAVGIKFAFDAGKAAADFAETSSKVTTIFGQNAKEIQMFGEGAAKALGQNKQEAMDAAANFAIFGKSAGKRGKDLVKFSTRLVSAAADMASFSNTTPTEAIDALGSALRGESEPIRRYGVLLNDQVLKQRAFKIGLIKTTKDALTPQNKVLAANAEIFAQLGKNGSKTLGDFARTSGGFANQQRIFKAGFDNFRISLGEKLLPIMTKVTRWGNEKFLPFLEDVRKGFSGETNDKVTNKLKNLGGALGFGDGKSAGFTLGEALKNMADAFGLLLKNLSGSEGGASTLTQLADAMTKIADAITKVTTAVSGAGKWWGDFSGSSGKKVNLLGDPQKLSFARRPGEGWGDWISRVRGAKASGGPVLGGKPYLVGENGPEMFVPSSNGGIRTAAQTRGMLGGGVTINLNGIVDADSARRSIEQVLQNSGKRLGGINLTGSAL